MLMQKNIQIFQRMNYSKNIGSKTKLDKWQNNVIIHGMKRFYVLLAVYLFVVFLIGAIVLFGVVGLSGNDMQDHCLDMGFGYNAETNECITE